MRPAHYSAVAVLLATVLCGCEATRSARHSSNTHDDSGLSSPASGGHDLRPTPGPPPPVPPAVGVSHRKIKSVGFLRHLSGPSHDSPQDGCTSGGCVVDGCTADGCGDSWCGNGCGSSVGHRMGGLFAGIKELLSGCNKPRRTGDSCGSGSCGTGYYGSGFSPYDVGAPISSQPTRHFGGSVPQLPQEGSYNQDQDPLPAPVPAGPLPDGNGSNYEVAPLPVPPHSSLQIYQPSTPSASTNPATDHSQLDFVDQAWVMPPQWRGRGNPMSTVSQSGVVSQYSGPTSPIWIRSALKSRDW